jgi:hypothetical protein
MCGMWVWCAAQRAASGVYCAVHSYTLHAPRRARARAAVWVWVWCGLVDDCWALLTVDCVSVWTGGGMRVWCAAQRAAKCAHRTRQMADGTPEPENERQRPRALGSWV